MFIIKTFNRGKVLDNIIFYKLKYSNAQIQELEKSFMKKFKKYFFYTFSKYFVNKYL